MLGRDVEYKTFGYLITFELHSRVAKIVRAWAYGFGYIDIADLGAFDGFGVQYLLSCGGF